MFSLPPLVYQVLAEALICVLPQGSVEQFHIVDTLLAYSQGRKIDDHNFDKYVSVLIPLLPHVPH
tara:strand:+ start:526 stop:720 length:195 start_codon:yes stop_codon:yes gene_type:complete